MLHRLCGPPSIHLSFNLAAVLPRRSTYCVSCATDSSRKPTASRHRLRRGLPGYLILFDPHAFAPQRQYQTRVSPSPLTFLPISTHFTATPEIPHPSSVLQPPSSECRSQVEPGDFTSSLDSRLRALHAVIPINACTLRITAAAGTELAGAYSAVNVNPQAY